MTTIPGLEDAMREEYADAAEEKVAEHAEHLADEAGDRFDAYASRNGYDLGHLSRDIEVGSVRRRGNRVSATVAFNGFGTGLFEYGVDPFVMEGSPILAFFWEGPPGGTRPPGAPEYVVDTEINWGSVTGGIPEARAIRTALQVVGRAMRGNG